MRKLVSKRPIEPDVSAALAAELDCVFADAALAPASEIAKLLDISPARLVRLGDAKQIGFQRKGYSWRYYAREDVEAYLMSKPPEMRVQPPPVLKNVICIAEARARLRA